VCVYRYNETSCTVSASYIIVESNNVQKCFTLSRSDVAMSQSLRASMTINYLPISLFISLILLFVVQSYNIVVISMAENASSCVRTMYIDTILQFMSRRF
jgi:hypothetical protein